MNAMTYGDWLRRERKARHFTQEELGNAIGKHRTHVNRIENGGIDLPEDRTRELIHAALGTTDDDLVAVGIFKRLDHPHSDQSTYVLASSIPPEDHDIREALRPHVTGEGVQRVRDALQVSGLTTDQYNAVVTILDAFWRDNEGRET